MNIKIRSLIEGLSYALDVAEKSYFSHSKHVAFFSVCIAKELDLSETLFENLYYSALLHDIGASNTYNIEDHCIVGQQILIKLPVNPKIANYVYYHHEQYNGTGIFQLTGDNIPLQSQIISIANLFDTRFAKIEKVNLELMDSILLWVEQNSVLFNPEIIIAFKSLIKKEYFLLDYFSHEFEAILNRKINFVSAIIEFEAVRNFAFAFSEIIDNRSHFTYRHSVGIANLTKKITTELGYDEEIQEKMFIAALLHDIGKLMISNKIIDKEGKLSREDRYEINKHTYYTRWILEQINGFEDIVNYAANHHEKINGTGYPLHLFGNQISELDRIMAICDVYQALTEDRPYRNKMPIKKVWSIIDNMVENNELDEYLVKKIKLILREDNI